MKDRKKKVIVLGGGISGLSAGEILSKYFKVEIYEKENFLGGLASSFKQNNMKIPFYYHHIIRSNKLTLRYLQRFVRPKKLNWQKIKVAIGVNKKIRVVNSVLGLLKFDYLSLYEKFRFGLFGIYSLFFMNPNKIQEGLDAKTWLNKYVGRSVTEKIFYNLYGRNKFNLSLEQISAKQFVNRLYEKEIQDLFCYPREGIDGIIKGLSSEIKKNNGKIVINSKIKKIDANKKFIIEKNRKIKYDFLINTIPFEEFIELSQNLPKKLINQLKNIKYCPAVSVCFGTKKFLKPGVYWINLFNERTHIIMQHSVLNDNYNEKVNWILRYGGSEEDLNLTGQEIKEIYLKDVKKYFPRAEIRWARVFKTKYAEPIYDIEYHKNMPDYKTKIPGLYFAGIQLTHPKIRNINVAINSGRKVAKRVLSEEIEDLL